MSDLNSRDEEMAAEVGIMAELGKFEVEFTMYGCAFYENGKVMYLVSENAEKVYDFIYDIANAEKLPTDIHSASIRSLVPSGAEHYILNNVREQLLDKLYSLYDEQYFSVLFDLQNVLRTNEAVTVLKKLKYQLDGICNREQLQLFQGLLETAYRRKILKTESYIEFMQWIGWTRRDLEQELIRTDLYEKIFYGFAYWKENEPVKIYVDGYKNNIYKRIEQRRTEGYFVSNIIFKKYWYNNRYPVVEVKKNYETMLKELFGTWYTDSMEQFAGMNAPMKQTAQEKYLQYYNALSNEKTKYSLIRQYGLWGIEIVE